MSITMLATYQDQLTLEQFQDQSNLFYKVVTALPKNPDGLKGSAKIMLGLSLEAFEVGPYTGKTNDDSNKRSNDIEGEFREVSTNSVKDRIIKIWEKLKNMYFKALGTVSKIYKKVKEYLNKALPALRKPLRKFTGATPTFSIPEFNSKFATFAKGWALPTTKPDVMLGILTDKVSLDIIPIRGTFFDTDFMSTQYPLAETTTWLLNATKELDNSGRFKYYLGNYLNYLKKTLEDFERNPNYGYKLTGVNSAKEINVDNFSSVRLEAVRENYTDEDRVKLDKLSKGTTVDTINSFAGVVNKFSAKINYQIREISIIEANLETCGDFIKSVKVDKLDDNASETFGKLFNATGVAFNVYQARLHVVQNTAKISMLLTKFLNDIIEGFKNGE